MRIKAIGNRIPTAKTQRVPTAWPQRQHKPKVADPFYSSAPWIELRDRVRREANGRCQWPGCARHGRWVDHRIELRDGGAPLDRANLWLLCPSHHTIKTAQVKRTRDALRRGGGPKSLPGEV